MRLYPLARTRVFFAQFAPVPPSRTPFFFPPRFVLRRRPGEVSRRPPLILSRRSTASPAVVSLSLSHSLARAPLVSFLRSLTARSPAISRLSYSAGPIMLSRSNNLSTRWVDVRSGRRFSLSHPIDRPFLHRYSPAAWRGCVRGREHGSRYNGCSPMRIRETRSSQCASECKSVIFFSLYLCLRRCLVDVDSGSID